MCRHWCHLEIWEYFLYSHQLFFGEGHDEFVLVFNVGSDVLLGAELTRLDRGDELGIQLSSKDSFGGSKVVVVDIVGHGRVSEMIWLGRNDGILANLSFPYM